MPGKFITVEGVDGSGKSTLISMLNKEFGRQKIDHVITREPGGTRLGKQLLDILRHDKDHVAAQAEYLLFAADRAQHFSEIVIPHLEKGSVVISDRSADSSLVYQGHGRGVDPSMIKTINSWVMHTIVPDAILYLRISKEEALKRLAARSKDLTSFERQDPSFWDKLINGFEQIFTKRDNVITLDAEKPAEKVYEQALAALRKKGICQ